MTEYIVTRWYRAPEVILGSGLYDEKSKAQRSCNDRCSRCVVDWVCLNGIALSQAAIQRKYRVGMPNANIQMHRAATRIRPVLRPLQKRTDEIPDQVEQ